MKKVLGLISPFLILFLISNTSSAAVNIKITGKQAKALYNELTGPDVQSEGAAGHLYRKGKDVTCRYTDVDMTGKNGKPISRHDPIRYHCATKFNHNGYAFPSNYF